MRSIDIEELRNPIEDSKVKCKSPESARKDKKIRLKIKKYKTIIEKIENTNCDNLKEILQDKEYNNARIELTMARNELAALYMDIENYMHVFRL